MEAVTQFVQSLLGSIDVSQVSTLEMAKFLLIVIVVQVLLRTAAEALMRFAITTETKWDNKVARMLSDLTWYLGAFLGLFGIGTPKPMLDDQINEAKKNDESK
jgi:hypothetical protein